MAIQPRGNECRVGVIRKDGTPFKLMHDDIVKQMMIEWIKGVPIPSLCIKYNISNKQFHRQKYHQDRLLNEFLDECRALRAKGMNSREMSEIIGVSLTQMNKIITSLL